MMSALFHRLKDSKCKALLTGIDIELAKTGVVGTITKNKIATMKIKPSTPKLQQLINSGRVQMTGISLPGNILIVVF